MATLAVFLALGGGLAWALGKNSVKSKHIAQGQVKSVDVRDDGLRGIDIVEGQLGLVPAAGSADTARSAQSAQSAQSAESAQYAERAGDAATVGGIPPSELGTLGRTVAGGFCSDDDEDGENCITVTLHLPRAARLFVAGHGYSYSNALNDSVGPNSGVDQADRVRGFCSLQVDGSTTVATVYSQIGSAIDWHPFALDGVTDSLSAGTHTFTVRCQEIDGDIAFDTVSVSAVMLGNA